MRVILMDPSFFTLPYDVHLTDGLAKICQSVELVGRSLRQGERSGLRESLLRTEYYSTAEAFRGRLPTKLWAALKGVEHFLDNRRFARRLEKSVPDVVHFQWAPLPLIDLHLINRIRRLTSVVFTVHDTKPFLGSPTSTLQMRGWQRVLESVDALIVHTENGRQKLVGSGIAPEKVHVIPHGVLGFSEGQFDLASKSSVPRQEILLFGELKPYKGTEVLIQAFSMLPDALKDSWCLAIVGRPRMPVEGLRELARAFGIEDRIRWDLRFVPESEVPEIFNQALIYSFPYHEIDASGALMLSLPMGRPVVASDLPGFREVLGETMADSLFAPGQPGELAELLERFMSSPELRAEVGARAKELAMKQYSWETIALKTLEVYRTARIQWMKSR